LFGAAKRVLLGVSRCLALQPDHTTLAPELPLPGYRRKETETVFAQLLENTRKKKEGRACLHSLSESYALMVAHGNPCSSYDLTALIVQTCVSDRLQ
jgi:hypothetical protein